MTRAVFDASTVISGCGWGAESYQCLITVAKRRVQSLTTEAIIVEWRDTLAELESAGTRFKRSPWPTLEWLINASHIVPPSPLGAQVSRDQKDDPYIACAVAAEAQFIVSKDRDLLDLEKPFGVEIVTPRTFLSRLRLGS
jgi:uncharacterized protein